MNITALLPFFQLVLTFGNICVLAYALYKFLNRPHDTLEDRVNAHDVEIADIKKSLLQGNDRFREQDDTNEVLLHSVLALIEFEIQFCLVEHKEMSAGLTKAKEDLNNYLSKR